MSKIKWGVIGCGGIADRRTIPGMMLAENAECYAVMDINAEVSENVKNKYSATVACSDVDTLLAQDIDAVYIATPVFCHKEQVFKAADKGIHILLEKPMGITSEEAAEIKKYCENKNVLLGVGFMMRFHTAHQLIKEYIEKGFLGEIVSAYAKFNCWSPVSPVKWRQTKAFSGGGTMMDMGIHCIDLLQYMTNLTATEVTGMYGNQIFKYPDTEDAANAILRMNNGALFTIESNFNISDKIGGCKFEIYGTKGAIVADGTIGQTERGSVKLTTITDEGVVTIKPLEYESGNMYTKEIKYFSDAVLNKTKAPVTADEAILNQIIVEAVYESQESGVRIRI